MLVLHDDAEREYAYGPAQGLPDTKVGTFTAGAVRRGEEERLDGDQHEERLETHLRVRVVPQLQAHGARRQDVGPRQVAVREAFA